MKIKSLVIALAGIVLAVGAGAAPSYASGDCGPLTQDTAFCFVDNMAYLLGHNNLGGGIGISPKYQMALLP